MRKTVLTGLAAAAFAISPVFAQQAHAAAGQVGFAPDVVAALNDLMKAPKFGDSVNGLVYVAAMAMPAAMIPGFAEAAETSAGYQMSDKFGPETRQIVAAAATAARDSAVVNETGLKLVELYGERLSAQEIAHLAAFYRSAEGRATLTVLPDAVIQEAMTLAQAVLRPRVETILEQQRASRKRK